jgi:hypothetical protein
LIIPNGRRAAAAAVTPTVGHRLQRVLCLSGILELHIFVNEWPFPADYR